MTGFTVAHGTVADMTSPTSVPAHLLALDKPATPASQGDSALRSAIVSVASHYLLMARTRTPAEMESLIWQASSVDGADHGQSCAAFASLTLALGARAVGQQSWVTGGGSYPWPLHQWADVRVQPNPASPDVVSMLADAQAHHRWHPLGDGYRPRPGDWVLFDGHVEVVTRYSGAALYTVGADSLPGLTVNAHKFPAPFGGQGVLGFVNNGGLASTADASMTDASAPDDSQPASRVDDRRGDASLAPDDERVEVRDSLDELRLAETGRDRHLAGSPQALEAVLRERVGDENPGHCEEPSGRRRGLPAKTR